MVTLEIVEKRKIANRLRLSGCLEVVQRLLMMQ